MNGANGFTPTEKRILNLLSDGKPHRREEIHKCLDDELSELSTIQMHISNIRKRIRNCGEEIVCEYYQRSIAYRHVRLLDSPYDGRV